MSRKDSTTPDEPESEKKRKPAIPRPLNECYWLTPLETANYLGVSVTSIYRACASKGLRHMKVGLSTIRMRREWVDAWANDRAEGGHDV